MVQVYQDEKQYSVSTTIGTCIFLYVNRYRHRVISNICSLAKHKKDILIVIYKSSSAELGSLSSSIVSPPRPASCSTTAELWPPRELLPIAAGTAECLCDDESLPLSFLSVLCLCLCLFFFFFFFFLSSLPSNKILCQTNDVIYMVVVGR